MSQQHLFGIRAVVVMEMEYKVCLSKKKNRQLAGKSDLNLSAAFECDVSVRLKVVLWQQQSLADRRSNQSKVNTRTVDATSQLPSNIYLIVFGLSVGYRFFGGILLLAQYPAPCDQEIFLCNLCVINV